MRFVSAPAIRHLRTVQVTSARRRVSSGRCRPPEDQSITVKGGRGRLLLLAAVAVAHVPVHYKLHQPIATTDR